MRDFLLDTQIIRYWYDTECPQHEAVKGNVERLRGLSATLQPLPRLLVSVITLGEIEFGHRVQVGEHAEHNEDRWRFVHEQLPEPFEVTPDAVSAYGELRMRLFNKYAPGDKRRPGMRPEQLFDQVTALALQIQENDLWLCSQAIGHEMVLVTNDGMKAIREVAAGMNPALLIQDWTLPSSASVPK